MSENKFTIKSVRAREILDSRGNPTVEAEATTLGGLAGLRYLLVHPPAHMRPWS